MKRGISILALASVLLTASPAFADGIPSRIPSLEEPKHYSWEGFYIGAHGGYIWESISQTQTSGGMPVGPFDFKDGSFFGGGQAGFNFQRQNIVFGIEADLGYMYLPGKGRIPSSNPAAHQDFAVDSGFYGDITGKLGFAVERTLIYGKGGYAAYSGEAWQKTTNPGFVTHGSDKYLQGWVVGGGIEQAISSRVSLKLEYLHYDFGKVTGDQTSVTDIPIGFVYTNASKVEFDTVKLGVNFKLN